MTGFLLVVMGVGGCIGVATMFLLGRDEPATSPGGSPRADVLARITPPGVAPLAPARPATSEAGDGGGWAPDADGATVLAPDRPRRRRPLEGEPYVPAPWWQRLRSALGIVVIAFVLGALTAAAIGIVGFLLFTLLRGAVG